MCVYHTCLFTHLSMDTWDHFHFLTNVNHAAINMRVQIALQDPAFNSFGYIPISKVAGSYGNSF